MPTVQSLLSLATLASRTTAAQEEVDTTVTCTAETEQLRVLQTKLPPIVEGEASTDGLLGVRGFIAAVYSKDLDSLTAPTLEFDLDVSAMVGKLTTEHDAGTPLAGPFENFNAGEFQGTTTLTWAVYAQELPTGTDWAFGSDCVFTSTDVFDPSADTVLPSELGTVTISDEKTIKYVLPTNDASAIKGAVAAALVSDLPANMSIVLMATCEDSAELKPVFCAKVFSTSAVKDADGTFLVPAAVNGDDDGSLDEGDEYDGVVEPQAAVNTL